MCEGFVKRHEAILNHRDPEVVNLAGKKVQINLETATPIEGFGIRVEVTPKTMPGARPTTLFSHFLRVTDLEAKKILHLT